MIRVAFQRLAAKEFRHARSWYADRDLAVASRFVTAVDAAIDRICVDPGSHPVECGHFCWVRVRRFPYRLIFEHTQPDQVLIVAVAHISRRPRYWRRRRA